MDESGRDNDYEYGYDYLYEKEKPADAAADVEGRMTMVTMNRMMPMAWRAPLP